MSGQLKKIIIILSLVFVITVALGSLGVAYAGGIRGIGLLGAWFLLTFSIIVILAQLIPAMILLYSFISSVFFPYRKSELPIEAT
jgi:hypothetical protein